ncbi:MAG: TaqI-like C-terminal specificity domain-containing protein, partial [Pyrinomonadaceae bacterium]
LFVANTAYVIPTDDKYLLAILNSRMIYFYYSKIASVLGDAEQGGRLRWFTQDVVNLPIKDISIKMKTPFIEIVDQILELKKTGGETTGLERRIDEMVYDLYGLTAEEIAIVEGA